jgi:hypothetical protein
VRIGLDLNYVLRRSCDPGRPWVAWQPDTGFSMMGRTPTTALFLIRDVVRAFVSDSIYQGKHPRRHFAVNQERDADWEAHQEFLNRFRDEDADEEVWSHCYGDKYLPEHVDLAFVHNRMELETCGRHCLANDTWYGEFWYKSDGKINVTALVEMVYPVDRAEVDYEAYIRRHWGHTVKSIVGIEPRDPRDPR